MEQRFDDQVQLLRQKVKDLKEEHKRQLKLTKEAGAVQLRNQEAEHERELEELKVLGAERTASRSRDLVQAGCGGDQGGRGPAPPAIDGKIVKISLPKFAQ